MVLSSYGINLMLISVEATSLPASPSTWLPVISNLLTTPPQQFPCTRNYLRLFLEESNLNEILANITIWNQTFEAICLMLVLLSTEATLTLFTSVFQNQLRGLIFWLGKLQDAWPPHTNPFLPWVLVILEGASSKTTAIWLRIGHLIPDRTRTIYAISWFKEVIPGYEVSFHRKVPQTNQQLFYHTISS